MKEKILFWVKNRIVLTFLVWVIGFIVMLHCNPYINAIIIFVLFFGSLFFLAYLFEEKKANKYEIEMYEKISKFFDCYL